MRIINSAFFLAVSVYSSLALSQQFPSTEPFVPFPSSTKTVQGEPDFEKVIQFSRGSEIWELGRGVAHLLLSREGVCSGFLVASRLLMTNEHCVVRNGRVRHPSQIEVYMDYYEDGKPGKLSATGEEYLVISKPLDYALLLLDKPLGDTYPVLKLSPNIPVEDGQVKIIQHPKGRSKEVTRRNSEIVRVYSDGHVLHYLADTEGGSSGSPVFSLDGQEVIALHHAGSSEGYNEGVLMSSILKDLGMASGASAPDTRWRQYEKLVDNGVSIRVDSDRKSYTIGQNMTLDIDVPGSGYLHLINISRQDEMVLLFPNKYQRDNRVSAGRMVFPTDSMPFEMMAMEPAGEQLLVVLMTNEPLDLYSESDVAGKAVFAPLDTRSMSSMSRFTARSGQYWAGKVETKIVR